MLQSMGSQRVGPDWATELNRRRLRVTGCVVCCGAQPCPTLCDPMDYSPPGSSVHGILQARILEWVAISFSRGSSQPRDRTHISRVSPASAGRFFTTEPPGKPGRVLTPMLLGKATLLGDRNAVSITLTKHWSSLSPAVGQGDIRRLPCEATCCAYLLSFSC